MIAEVERHRARLERAHVERTAWPSSPRIEASWSSSPVSAPVYSFSIRWQRRARSVGRAARAGERRRARAPRDAERGRRRQAGLLREVALHRDRAAGEVHARGAQLGHGAAEVGVVVREPGRDDLAAVAQFRCHGDPAIDREGQTKAEVVIGVLADQIHASRRESPAPVRVHGRHPRAGGHVHGHMAESAPGRSRIRSTGDRRAASCTGVPGCEAHQPRLHRGRAPRSRPPRATPVPAGRCSCRRWWSCGSRSARGRPRAQRRRDQPLPPGAAPGLDARGGLPAPPGLAVERMPEAGLWRLFAHPPRPRLAY